MMANDDSIPTVGIFPSTFPRDPVEVNLYLEHTLLGQVIEPLVDCATDGTVHPAVASNWEISHDGCVIEFQIRENLYFSNGQQVTADDVQYTLERHISSPVSQSRSFLARIKKIEVNSPQRLTLRLDGPYLAILKALSRDHLGILPKGWLFQPESKEPFIGTGPYRAVKTLSGWHLKVNEIYRHLSSVRVPEWKVIVEDDYSKLSRLPDLIPNVPTPHVPKLREIADLAGQQVLSEPLPSYGQTSAWWSAHGDTHADESRKLLGMQTVQALIERQASKAGLKLATGLIPEGIQGHLPSRLLNTESLHPLVRNRKFSICVLNLQWPMLYSVDAIHELEERYSIQLELRSFTVKEFPTLPSYKPDIVVFGFAGGFQDPEGFLMVASSMLSSKPDKLLGPAFETYLRASIHQSWDARADLYQDVNSQVVESRIMVPGWRSETSRLRTAPIDLANADNRYTSKLKDFTFLKRFTN